MRRCAGAPVRRSPVRRSPIRRSPVAGSPVTSHHARLEILMNALAYHDICCITIGRTRRRCALQVNNRRLFPYKKAARFQLRHAVLEVVRTEWSTNASSWKQGRFTPVVTVGSEGLKDGRHQCFEVGPTCVDLFRLRQQLEVYTPVRRYANSPVYADSPVYQSVVLSVGSLYAGSPVHRFAGIPIYWFGTLEVQCAEQGTSRSIE